MHREKRQFRRSINDSLQKYKLSKYHVTDLTIWFPEVILTTYDFSDIQIQPSAEIAA